MNEFSKIDSRAISGFSKRFHERNLPGAVVINSGDSNGYGVIVNLGRKGVPVLSVSHNPQNITFYSKYAHGIICPDYRESEKLFIDFLVDIGKVLTMKPVLYVTGDLQLLCILRHRKKLEEFFHIPSAPLDIVRILVDKICFYNTLEKLNIPHAKTFVPNDLSEVEQECGSLDYPCIIKPVQSTSFVGKFGSKCLEANSARELLHLYEMVAGEEDHIIIQKEIIGAERYLVYMYLDSESHPKAVCCYKKLRIQPIDFGNASTCFTVWEPEVVKLAHQCLREIGYTGLAEAEIQRDQSDGELKLVEINARSTTQTRLAARYGMNMEYLAYREILGEKIAEIRPAKSKIVWIDIVRDILAVFAGDGYLAQKQLTIGQVMQSLKGKREYAYLAWDDPIPFLVLFFRFLKTYVFRKKIFSSLIKKPSKHPV